jgi:hypothetical protein
VRVRVVTLGERPDLRPALERIAAAVWPPSMAYIRVAPRSMIEGRVREWEGWTGLQFPQSGRYVVPGALVPVTIDRRRDRGRYVEPNVWMLHPV